MALISGGLDSMLAARAVMALSPGTSDLRLERLPFERLQRPVFPLDGEFDWKP